MATTMKCSVNAYGFAWVPFCIFFCFTATAQRNSPFTPEQAASLRAFMRAMSNQPPVMLGKSEAPLIIKGIRPDVFHSFSNRCRQRIVLEVARWLDVARPDYTNTIGELEIDTDKLTWFEVRPLTNALYMVGQFSKHTNGEPAYSFTTWCSRVVRFEDHTERVPESSTAGSTPGRSRINERKALALAQSALAGSASDEKSLRLGTPKIARIKIPLSTAKGGQSWRKTPYYSIEWVDEKGGLVGVIVSGLTKRVVFYDNGSRFIPREIWKGYYDELGVAGAPADVGPTWP